MTAASWLVLALLGLPSAGRLATLRGETAAQDLAEEIIDLQAKHADRPVVAEVVARTRQLADPGRTQALLCAGALWRDAPWVALPFCEAAHAAPPAEASQAERARIALDRLEAMRLLGQAEAAHDGLAEATALVPPEVPMLVARAAVLGVALALDLDRPGEAVTRGAKAAELLMPITRVDRSAGAFLAMGLAQLQFVLLGQAPVARDMLQVGLQILPEDDPAGLRPRLQGALAQVLVAVEPRAALGWAGRTVDTVHGAGRGVQRGLLPALLALVDVAAGGVRRPDPEHPMDAEELAVADRLANLAGTLLATRRPNRGQGLALLAAQGMVRAGLGRMEAARAAIDEALVKSVGRSAVVRDQVLLNAAHLAEMEGRSAWAIWANKQALEGLAWGDKAARAMGGEARAAWLARHRELYESLARRLVAAGRLAEATALERQLKADEFERFRSDDARGAAGEGTLGATTAEAAASTRLAVVQGPLTRVARLHARRQQARVALLLAGEPVPDTLRAELEAGDAWLTAARALWLETLEQASEALTARAEGAGPPPLAAEALQATLAREDPPAAILQVIVAPRRTHLLLTTAQAQVAHTVEVPAARLNAEVAALRQAVGNPQAPYRAAAEQVYRRIIGPVRGELNAAGIKTLVVSLDGALRYVPLAALVDPATGRHLVERFALARYHDAARGLLERAGAADWRVAGLGVSEAKAGFTPLPAVKDELEAIVRRADDDPDGVAQGIVRLDAAFDRDTLAAALAGPFPGVHLASHFQFNPGVDRSSFLLLGDGAKLTVADLWQGSFDFKGVDLLVLSACETAVDGGDGREVDGLAGVVQRRGVRTVVASLWPVADGTTAALMTRFYGGLTAGTPRAQALQAAQTAFLRGAVKGHASQAAPSRGVARVDGGGAAFKADAERPYAHPYYWAPFVLMGAWR